jgi:ribosomal protein S18 acetylase RimI-like enzyme
MTTRARRSKTPAAGVTNVRLAVSRDRELNRALFARGLPGCHWVGDHHTFWVAWDGPTPVGFCSAVPLGDGSCFLSSAAVFAGARGAGLQRRMVRLRLAWAARHGQSVCVTYATRENFRSIANLIRCGFHFYEPAVNWAGRAVVYLRRDV